MFDFRAVRIRIIALAIMIAALFGYFAGKIGAQPLEASSPDFIVRRAGVDVDYSRWYQDHDIYKIYSPKTGQCWIEILNYGKNSFVLQTTPEICR